MEKGTHPVPPNHQKPRNRYLFPGLGPSGAGGQGRARGRQKVPILEIGTFKLVFFLGGGQGAEKGSYFEPFEHQKHQMGWRAGQGKGAEKGTYFGLFDHKKHRNRYLFLGLGPPRLESRAGQGNGKRYLFWAFDHHRNRYPFSRAGGGAEKGAYFRPFD